MSITVRVDVRHAVSIPEGLRAAITREINGTGGGGGGPIAASSGAGSGGGNASVGTSGGGHFNAMFRQWVSRYMAFCRRHFDLASAGGADWAPLAQSTILSRKAAKGAGTRGQQRTKLFRQLRGIRDVKVKHITGGTRQQRVKKQDAAYLKAKLANERSASKRTAIKDKIAALTSSAGVAILRDTGGLYSALAVVGKGSFTKRGSGNITFGYSGNKHVGTSATYAQIAAWHDSGAGNLPRRRILIDPDADLIRSFVADAQTAVDRTVLDLSRRGVR